MQKVKRNMTIEMTMGIGSVISALLVGTVPASVLKVGLAVVLIASAPHSVAGHRP